MTRYYVLEHDQPVGPIEAEELRRRLVAAGQPNPDLQINSVGTLDWMRVSEVEGFKDLFAAPAPSPAPKKPTQTSWLKDTFRLVAAGIVVFVGSLTALGLFATGSGWMALLVLGVSGYLLHKLSSGSTSLKKKKEGKRPQTTRKRSSHPKAQSKKKPNPIARLQFEVTVGDGARRRIDAFDTDDFWGYDDDEDVQRSVKAEDVWVAPGQPVQAHGLTLPGGMMYVGKGLGAVREYGGLEPSLLNPDLPVSLTRPDTSGEALDYWPSYSGLSKAARGAYLQWLAAGRATPNAPIGYVFLFFYGLERRLLIDARLSDVAKEEVPTLVVEVERLLNLYGHNNSFRHYAQDLLSTIRVLFPQSPLSEQAPPRTSQGYDLPIHLLAGIGERIVQSKPITGPWAFSWFMNHPEARLRTPAHRCAAEFENLFLTRFEQKYPDGLKLKPNKRRLKHEHRTASAGLLGCDFQVGDLPDVRGIRGPMKKFSEIAAGCMDELDAYSRYLGRNPGAAGTPQALALLPAELGASEASDEVRKLKDYLEQALASHGTLEASALMEHWEHTNPDKLSKKEATSFAVFLERLGAGLEPDVRFGGPGLKRQGKAVVFRLGASRVEKATREYLAATVLMHLAAIVAAADGVISPEEERHLEHHLEETMHLQEAETDRLRAHLRWLLEEQPGMAGLKKRLEALTPVTKRQIASFAASVAGADGRIDPAEVKVLQKLYKMLGFPQEEVFKDIHAMVGAPATQPVTVSLDQGKRPGRAIPAPPEEAASHPTEEAASFNLDMERVKQKMQDTAEVAGLLSDIFSEAEEPEPPDVEPPPAEEEDTLAGLDGPHTELLLALGGTVELTREQFEQLCSTRSLMPDAAFELLNDAAFNRSDAPVLIGDDPIDVDETILQEMCS